MILDTCALLWLANEQSHFTPDILSRLEQAPAVFVSAITAFEIGVKFQARKLILPLPPQAWFQQTIEHHGLAVIDLDPSICLKAAELPPIHRDPCDRFIIATALANGLPVVTADSRFEKYGVEVLL